MGSSQKRKISYFNYVYYQNQNCLYDEEGEKVTSEVLKSELNVNIDAKRKEMIEAAEVGGYTSEKAIKCSQELDMYLNKYHQVLLEEENNTDGHFLQFVKTMKKWNFQDLQFL